MPWRVEARDNLQESSPLTYGVPEIKLRSLGSAASHFYPLNCLDGLLVRSGLML